MAHLLRIVDDRDLIQQQVCQAFPAPMHRVDVAATGDAGLGQIRNTPPDVIFLDLRLPDRSGLEVYQAIRAIDARIPVIFATMTKTADTAIEAVKQGALRSFPCRHPALRSSHADVTGVQIDVQSAWHHSCSGHHRVGACKNISLF